MLFFINAGPKENGEEGQITQAAGGVRDPHPASSGAKREAQGDWGQPRGEGGQDPAHEGVGPPLLRQVSPGQ